MCLTEVKSEAAAALEDSEESSITDSYEFGVPSLLEELLADTRIPVGSGGIRKENLVAFAEWQRRIDQALDRPAPRWVNGKYVRLVT